MKPVALVLAATLVLAALYPACAPRSSREARLRSEDGGRERVLTVAHYSLQSGFRKGFRATIDAYEARHPDVRIEVIEVPAAVWANWLTTKLVGRMAPDLIQVGLPPGGSMSSQAHDEMLSRHFLPIRDAMNQPNPYAAGTAYADVAWRQTFADGLMWPPSYSLTNFEIYGVPFTLFANRLVYNRDLLVEIAGHDEPPKDFRDFLELCARIREHGRRTGRSIVPIAAARNTGPALMESFFGSVTQWLRIGIDPHRQFTLYPTDTLRAAIGGNFDPDHEEVRAGLELAREVALQCTPGFMQLDRDSATFLFAQKQALMMLSNPVDVSALRDEVGFALGVCRVPWPTVDDPRYGRHVMGPLNESQGGLQNSLGIALTSQQADLAIDFLRFASSPEGATRFAGESGLPSAVVAVDLASAPETLRPVHGGYPPGLQLGFGRPELAEVFERHAHHLLSPAGSVDAFVAVMRAEFPAAAVAAAHGFQRNWRRSIRQRDGAIGAYTWLRTHGDAEERQTAEARWGVLLDNDSQADAHLYILERALESPGPLSRYEAPPVGSRRPAKER
jgi:ABC-type glycerol-3-phosphate transport system substrate-binding protein